MLAGPSALGDEGCLQPSQVVLQWELRNLQRPTVTDDATANEGRKGEKP